MEVKLRAPSVVIFITFIIINFGVVISFKFSSLEEEASGFGDDVDDAAEAQDADDADTDEDDEMQTVAIRSLESWGRYGDLAVAFPLAIQNLTNFSGLINGQAADSENITYKFGNPKDDEELLYDKVSGFFTVLHESMEGQDGPRYCPRHSLKHIKECVVIASCLLQSQVPEYVEMSMYASMIELMDRFVEVAWPLVERGILKEENYRLATLDEEVPAKYQCDDFTHAKPFVSHLQENEGVASAFAMSAVLAQKADATTKILDSHRQNMSLEATIGRVMEVWRPICLKAHVFSCDEGNFWDLHYASHRQTMALMQTGAASAVRAEIRTRLRLERRVQDFMREHSEAFGAFLQTSGRERNYFDFRKKSNASVQIWKDYGKAGKEAMFGFVMPYSRAVAATNFTRASVCFDQVEFRKFQKDEQLDLELEEPAEDRRMMNSTALLSVRQSDGLEDTSARRRRFGGKLKKAAKKAKKKAKKVKKDAKKAAKKVSKAVKVIEKWVTMLFGCVGDVFEFITVGYSLDIVEGAVAFGAGLSMGDMTGFLKLLTKGRKPSTWLSVDIGFTVGVTVKAAWSGVGAGLGLSCGYSSCVAYLSVGTMTTVNLPTVNAVCVFGAPYSPQGWQCSQVFGGSISAFCCNFNVAKGKHDCR